MPILLCSMPSDSGFMSERQELTLYGRSASERCRHCFGATWKFSDAARPRLACAQVRQRYIGEGRYSTHTWKHEGETSHAHVT